VAVLAVPAPAFVKIPSPRVYLLDMRGIVVYSLDMEHNETTERNTMTAAQTFKKGDRVIVTDLRTGTQHPGTVTKPPAEPSDVTSQFMNVRYDTGQEVRVGKGFVRMEQR
jgi:hypothetical protein